MAHVVITRMDATDSGTDLRLEIHLDGGVTYEISACDGLTTELDVFEGVVGSGDFNILFSHTPERVR